MLLHLFIQIFSLAFHLSKDKDSRLWQFRSFIPKCHKKTNLSCLNLLLKKTFTHTVTQSDVFMGQVETVSAQTACQMLLESVICWVQSRYFDLLPSMQTLWQHSGFCSKESVVVQAWLCNYLHLALCVFCVLIYSVKPSQSRRWPDRDLQWLARSSVRNGPGWHVSAMINEQVFGLVLSKWSHYWWPQSSLCVASISDDFQAPAALKGDVVILWVREGLTASGPGCSVCHGEVKLSYLDWWPHRGKFTGTAALWQPMCGLAVTCSCHHPSSLKLHLWFFITSSFYKGKSTVTRF